MYLKFRKNKILFKGEGDKLGNVIESRGIKKKCG